MVVKALEKASLKFVALHLGVKVMRFRDLDVPPKREHSKTAFWR